MPDGGVLINETVPPPQPWTGLLINEPVPPFGVFGGFVGVPPAGVPAGNLQAVLGRVCWFEEVTDRSQDFNLDGNQRMTRTFQVMTSHPLVGSTTVALFDQLKTPFEPPDPGARWNGKPQRRVPQPGDKYVELDANWNVVHTNDHVVCVGSRVFQSDPENLRNWTVVAEYAGETDPVAQPHDVKWGHVPYQAHLLTEVEALPPNEAPRPILNTAGDPFQEGAIYDADRFEVAIVKNVISFNPVAAKEYHNTVNDATVLAAQHPPGFPAGTCKIKLSAERIRRSSNTDFYWQVVAMIEINPDGWDLKVRNAGYEYLPGGVKAKKQNISLHPRYFARPSPMSPQLLKPNGDLALPEEPIPDPLVFRRYRRKDWTELGFLLNY